MKICLILLTAFFTFGCFSFNQASFYLPSDKRMQNNFLKNEIEFNELIKMISEEDSSITSISRQKDKSYLDEKISDSRWNEYQKLLNKANLFYGITRHDNFDGLKSITFFNSSEDLSGQTAKDPYDEFLIGEKGYAYSTTKLSPLVDSLDSISDEELGKKGFFFKEIKDNWYLYYRIRVRKPE